MDVEGNGDTGEWGQEGMGAWRGCGDTDTEKIRRQTQEDSEAWGHRQGVGVGTQALRLNEARKRKRTRGRGRSQDAEKSLGRLGVPLQGRLPAPERPFP